MKIRCYSDLHLDHYGKNELLWYPPELPDDKDTILILAGDTWIGTRWIEYAGESWIGKVAPRFKYVIKVLGNHCFWPLGNSQLTIKTGADKCNALLHDRGHLNVIVLDKQTHMIDDVLFVGATLWTDMDKHNPFTMYNMTSCMQYDGKIAYQTGPNSHFSRFTSEKWCSTHNEDRIYIDRVAKENRDKKIVVITHHLPLTVLTDPIYDGHNSNGYYSSDLSNLILDNDNIKYWFFGHSHCRCVIKLDEMPHCTFVNRAVGYASEPCSRNELVKHDIFEI